jgi:preprotein translocase subunit SecB
MMTDSTDANVQAQKNAGALPIRVNAQYVKDLSFENPRAPHSLQPQEGQPKVDVHVDVKATKLADSVFEVVLTTTVNGTGDEGQMFLAELSYGGVFTLEGLPEQHLQPVLLIECPRLLFPFARNIIADVTRDGGFPPLLIQPVDFGQLYRQSQNGSSPRSAEETIVQ